MRGEREEEERQHAPSSSRNERVRAVWRGACSGNWSHEQVSEVGELGRGQGLGEDVRHHFVSGHVGDRDESAVHALPSVVVRHLDVLRGAALDGVEAHPN